MPRKRIYDISPNGGPGNVYYVDVEAVCIINKDTADEKERSKKSCYKACRYCGRCEKYSQQSVKCSNCYPENVALFRASGQIDRCVCKYHASCFSECSKCHGCRDYSETNPECYRCLYPSYIAALIGRRQRWCSCRGETVSLNPGEMYRSIMPGLIPQQVAAIKRQGGQ